MRYVRWSPGFLVKNAPAEQLADAIRTVHADSRVVDPRLAAQALSEGGGKLPTNREHYVLREAVTGASAKHIAARLQWPAATMRNHLSDEVGKTQTSSRSEAVRAARGNDWLSSKTG